MILFQRLGNHTLPLPKRHDGAAFDMRADLTENPFGIILKPGEVKPVSLGFAMEVTDIGMCGFLMPRSSLGSKGIILANTIGLIDPSYRGPLTAMMYNSSEYDFRIDHGDRICQLLILPYLYFDNDDLSVAEVDELSKTERGSGGFGSTGVN